MCSGPQFYATFLNATSSVRVATIRCALSSRCRRFLYPRPRLISKRNLERMFTLSGHALPGAK